MHRSHQGFLILGAAVSTVAMAGCGAGTAATATSSAAPDADRSGSCAGLVAEIVPLHGVAAGSSFADLVVDNQGRTACTLPASPRIAFADTDHQPLAVEVGTDPAAKPFTLAVGASAAMVISYGSDYNPPCHGELAYIRLTPPGVEVPFGGEQNCVHGRVLEGTWVAGSYAAPS